MESRFRLKNYNLEWTNLRGSPARGRYRVFVRDGEVKAIYSVVGNGREIVAKPSQPRFYSVDGLFLTIKDEIAQLDTATPFGQPKGATAVLRFKPDPVLGYPRKYIRDVMGSAKGVAIEVVKLEQDPPAAIPPPVDPTPPR